MKIAITRSRLVTAFTVVALTALVVWVASHTYWGEANVPMPLRGEAATDPFYAAERFVDALGAHARLATTLDALPDDGVLVLAGWDWSLNTRRRERLESWVESGGRLVVDESLLDGGRHFEDWSLIARVEQEMGADERQRTMLARAVLGESPCRTLTEHDTDDEADAESASAPRTLTICGVSPGYSLLTDRTIRWALRDESGIHAVRVNVGDGAVTQINALPFRGRDLLAGDQAALLVAAMQLRSGDDVVFLSEPHGGSLLALTWRHGAPVVVLLAIFTALALWRGAARFGPLVAVTDGARRSLAEQIRGTGQFALRMGGGEALHMAAVRALTEAAVRRIAGYPRLPQVEQVAAVAKLTGVDAAALSAAFVYPGAHRAHDLRNALAQLEHARRRILAKTAGSKHGN